MRTRADFFTTTHWSLVLAASDGERPDAREALGKLCEKYWQPLYLYVRRGGYSVEDAQDLTQEFFTRLIEKNYLRDANRERGRFRSFLLAAVKHFLANEWHRARTAKRGGGQVPLSLDFEAAEGKYGLEALDRLTPDRVFDRRWALDLLSQVLATLERQYAGVGKAGLFNQLRPFLTSDQTPRRYGDLAAEMGMSPGALRVAVHRLRTQFQDLLRAEIAQTLNDPADVDEEVRDLFCVFR